MKRKEIQQYNLADFVEAVVQASKEGYELDLQSNENYPIQIGVGVYTCAMLMKEESDVVDDKAEELVIVLEVSEEEEDDTIVEDTPEEKAKPKRQAQPKGRVPKLKD